MAAEGILLRRGQDATLQSTSLQPGEAAVALDTGNFYVGTTSGKMRVGGDVNSVAGRKGDVVLNKSDVGLGNVDNTADANKTVAAAAKLTNARTIVIQGDASASGSFDGSSDLSLALTLASSGVTAGTYTKLTVNTKGIVTGASTITIADVSGAGTAAGMNAGVAGGVATLDANGQVPVAQLPEDVLGSLQYKGVFNAATWQDSGGTALPTPAAVNKGWFFICTTAGTNASVQYGVGDWIISNGSSWDRVADTTTVFSVAGKTGVVVLTKSDVGLGNVDNTADASKSVASAAKLTTSRTIGLGGVTATAQAFDGSQNITITVSSVPTSLLSGWIDGGTV